MPRHILRAALLMRDRGVTSISSLLGRDVAMADVERSVVARFAAVFEREAVEA